MRRESVILDYFSQVTDFFFFVEPVWKTDIMGVMRKNRRAGMKREDTVVTMQDGRPRKVRVALPEDYDESDRAYPVLFMFDGQNLFDEEDSFAGTVWGVDRALDHLIREGKAEPMIIVGIDNKGEERLDEYGPWAFQVERYSSRGEGKDFARYFIEHMIPELEQRYRLSCSPRDRFLAGSSMGGLITAYIGTRYRGMFSSLGIFSISSWVSEKEFLRMIKEEGDFSQTRFFIQVGTEEVRDEISGKVDFAASQRYIESTLDFIRSLAASGGRISDMSIHIGAGKTHNEAAWSSYMPDFIQWLSGAEQEE